MYVTLEPCAHHGRTPPCVDAVIDAGLRAVSVATLDPDPRTNGKGIERLRAAGIAVTVGEGEAAAKETIEAFSKHVTAGLPFVTAKFAMSLDGKVATATGESRWISGEASRRLAHQLRATSDAVMVGIGTVLADDPRLTVRDVPVRGAQPLRVVIDSNGQLPSASAMLAEPGETLVFTAAGRAIELGGRAASVATSADGAVDLAEAMAHLGGRGATSVLVEGGPTLLGALFDAGLVDKVVAFVAPVVLGAAAAAPGPVGGAGISAIADALRLERVRYAPSRQRYDGHRLRGEVADVHRHRRGDGEGAMPSARTAWPSPRRPSRRRCGSAIRSPSTAPASPSSPATAGRSTWTSRRRRSSAPTWATSPPVTASTWSWR